MNSQGLGLFAARDIEKQTMVIEYNGTILRNEVAIRKDKVYRSQVCVFVILFVDEITFDFIYVRQTELSSLSSSLSLTEPSSIHVPHRQ